MPEQIAAAKVKKNRRNLRKSWLACINIGRTRDILDLLSMGKNVSDLMQRLRTENVSNPQESGKNLM